MLDDSNPPFYKWFADGTLNVSYNCLDRHVEAGGGDKPAYIWIGEPGDERTFTYAELLAEVEQRRQRAQGARRRARATASRSTCRMVPELAIAMLACARIGATHSVVFGGFSADVARRPHPGRRVQGRRSPPTAAGAAARSSRSRTPSTRPSAECPSVEKVLVVRRTGERGRRGTTGATSGGTTPWPRADAALPAGADGRRDIRSSSSTPPARPASPRASLHTTAGYLLGVDLHAPVGLRPQGRRRLLVHRRHRLGHRALLRRLRPAGQRRDGRRSTRARPTTRTRTASGRSSSSYRVTIFYTAPTAIRAFIKWGESGRSGTTSRRCACSARSASRSTPRRGCGTTSTSAAAAARSSTPGGRPRPGAIMISPLPGATPPSPARPRGRCRASSPTIVDEQGKPVPRERRRLSRHQAPVAVDAAHASAATTSATSSSTGAASRRHVYFTGDGARRDEDGYFWLMGRVDDVINVAGHRLGDHGGRERARVATPRSPRRRSSAGRRAQGRGDRRVRDPAGRASTSRRRAAQGAARARREGDRPARPARHASASRPTCRRRARARSCAACCATSPRAASSATPRPCATRRSCSSIKSEADRQLGRT